MTEQEWLQGANPAAMVSLLRQRKASERKLRLFGCACCRRIWERLSSEASRRAVVVAERYADKLAKRKDLADAARLRRGGWVCHGCVSRECDGSSEKVESHSRLTQPWHKIGLPHRASG